MSSVLNELNSAEKPHTVPFKEISLRQSFIKSFDILPKQILYQLMLSISLKLQIFVLFTYKYLSSPL